MAAAVVSGVLRVQRIACLAAAAMLVALALIFPSDTRAGPALNRIWVSGKGADVAGCAAATNPCRTLQYAHNNLSPGGQIYVLDPSGYGGVTITKPISIINDGVGDVIVETAGAGQTTITINAGPNDAVNLRGLLIEGNGGSPIGIQFNSGQSLSIENCVIRDVTQTGIAFTPSLCVLNTGPTLLAHSTTATAIVTNRARVRKARSSVTTRRARARCGASSTGPARRWRATAGCSP
jgi:hypothetical protein